MKKIIVVTLIVMMSVATFCFNASAANSISVCVEGDRLEFDVQPQIIDGRTMVPMRKIFESFDATVEWEQTTKTITGKKDDITITMRVDDKNFYVNDVSKTLDVAPTIIDGRTLVPVRAIAESLNVDVLWYGDISTVAVYNDKNAIEYKQIYNLDGNLTEIDANFEKEYLALGWAYNADDIKVRLYAPDGRTVDVKPSEVESQIAVGWYTEPVSNLYAADGRTTVVPTAQVDSYVAVGWYREPVTVMYATDGRTVVVGVSEVGSYKSVGWYESKEAADAAVKAADPQYAAVRQILAECKRYVSLADAAAGVLEAQVDLYRLNRKASLLVDMQEKISHIDSYVTKIHNLCASERRLYPLYSSSNITPVVVTSSSTGKAASYASKVKTIKIVFDSLCKNYGLQ